MVADDQGGQRQGGLTGRSRTNRISGRFPPDGLGQEIEARISAVPDRVFKARINAINSASDLTTRRVVVRSVIEHAMRRTYCAALAVGTGAAFVSCVTTRASAVAAIHAALEAHAIDRQILHHALNVVARLRERDALDPVDRIDRGIARVAELP